MRRTLRAIDLTLIITLLTALQGCPLTGCISLKGAGEMGFGYRSETKVFIYHTVDGDKQGKEAESSINLERAVEDYANYLRAKAEFMRSQTEPAADVPK